VLKIRKPVVPAIMELRKTAILETWIISGSAKAKSVMKTDMVKPIPPRKPAPMICFQDISLGN
jgi:hypothetical protein